MEPDLLSIGGRVEHRTIDDAVDRVESGLFPGWRVIYDRIRLEMVSGYGQQPGWSDLGGAAHVFTQASTQSPARVWVLVLEDAASGRRETLKFLLVGGDAEAPVWARIRPDAGTPIPARRLRLRPRRPG